MQIVTYLHAKPNNKRRRDAVSMVKENRKPVSEAFL